MPKPMPAPTNTPALALRSQQATNHESGLAINLPQVASNPNAWHPKPNAPNRALGIIMAASDGLLFADLDREVRRELVLAELHKTAMRLGHKESIIDAHEARNLRDDLASTLLTLYPRLTVKEFQYALMLGATGELTTGTEFDAVNLRTLSRWFRTYAKVERPAALEYATPVELPPPPDPRPPFTDLPLSHPVLLRAFVYEVAGWAEALATSQPVPPLLFTTSYAYLRLHSFGALREQATGYSAAACYEVLAKQAQQLATTVPRNKALAEQWHAFRHLLSTRNELANENHFSDLALQRARAIILRAFFNRQPTAEAMLAVLLPLLDSYTFTPPSNGI